MQDSPEKPASKNKARLKAIVSGTLIAVLAGAIGMQLARVKTGQAAEQTEQGTNAQTTTPTHEPVGKVNGEAITYEELAKECIERHGAEVLENVIHRKLIQQACSQAGTAVSADEVNTEIVRISKKFGLAQDQWEKMLLAERGLTPIQYRRDVIWPMLALKKLAGKEASITREMLYEAYEDTYGPRAQVKMIVLDNLRRAEEIQKKVAQSPDDFEDFARDYSVESNSRALGGTVPPIRKFSGAHKEIRKAAFKMKNPGQVSGIIQTDVNQYVILKFEGLTDPIEHDRKDVEKTLVEDLRERESQKLVANTFEKIKSSARIDNYLTGETLRPVQQASATAGGSVETAN